MAPEIVTELGEHSAYFEPFCGSMAVLFAKPEASQETVNDLHGLLINLARVLADPDLAAELYERAMRTLCHEGLYRDSRDWLDAHDDPAGVPDVDAAYHYLVCSWQGRNGTSGCVRTTWQPSIRYTPGGGSSGTRWCAAAESIPDWHQRLRRVVILQRDAFELLEKIDDSPAVAIYADPPYLMNTRGSGGGSRYLHDFRLQDHERLAGVLRRFKRARVVVSYYADPLLNELYDGWTFIDHTRQKNLHVQNRRGVGKLDAPEVLIINGESFVGSSGMLF